MSLFQMYKRGLDGLGRVPSKADRQFIKYCVMDVFWSYRFSVRLKVKLPR